MRLLCGLLEKKVDLRRRESLQTLRVSRPLPLRFEAAAEKLRRVILHSQ